MAKFFDALLSSPPLPPTDCLVGLSPMATCLDFLTVASAAISRVIRPEWWCMVLALADVEMVGSLQCASFAMMSHAVTPSSVYNVV
ncbi:hypothetical protein ACP4OV_031761 [Aristida adscensionis]